MLFLFYRYCFGNIFFIYSTCKYLRSCLMLYIILMVQNIKNDLKSNQIKSNNVCGVHVRGVLSCAVLCCAVVCCVVLCCGTTEQNRYIYVYNILLSFSTIALLPTFCLYNLHTYTTINAYIHLGKHSKYCYIVCCVILHK